MTSMTTTAARPGAAGRGESIGLTDIAVSEWTKLRSLRSTYWTLLVALLASVGVVTLAAAEYVAHYQPQVDKGVDAANFSLQGLLLAQLAIGSLGVLTISGEYATGMIRTTLAAVPQRRALLVVKGGIFGAVTLVVGEAMAFASFGIAQAIMHAKHIGASLGDPGVLRAVFGGGLYLTVVGLLAFGLGALLRRTAGALATFFGVLFLPSVIIDLLPQSWHDVAMRYAPANAGTQILATHHQHGMLGPWTGLGVLALYAAVVGVGAVALIGRRDA
jgi:ABC-2 type transport system permease protein